MMMDERLSGDVIILLPRIDMCNENGRTSPAVQPETALPNGEGIIPDVEAIAADSHEESNSQTPTESGISVGSSLLSESESPNDANGNEVQVEEIQKVKKRGKNYPPPYAPTTSTSKIPVLEIFSSDDDDEPPHSNIPLSQRRKNGYCTTKASPSSRRKKSAAALKRGTKNDREILNDIENPKPSTSAALMREMTRILNSVKNGTVPHNSTRIRDSQSSVEKSNTPKSVQKRSAPSRKLPLSQSQVSKKKKSGLPLVNKLPNKDRSSNGVFDYSSDKEELLELEPVAVSKKKRPVPVLVISSSDEESQKSKEVKSKQNGLEKGGQVRRKGKRKTEESDSAEIVTQGEPKKRKESGSSVDPEANSESRLNGGANGVNGHLDEVSVELPEEVKVVPKEPSGVEPKKKAKSRKKKGVIDNSVELSHSEVPESNVLPLSPIPDTNGGTDPADSESAGINAPIITIMSGRVREGSRRSVRERRPRQIDNAWIY